MNFKTLTCVALGALLLGFSVSAQKTAPRFVLSYADDVQTVELTSAKGAKVAIDIGLPIPASSTLRTGAGSAEVVIEPFGTVIRIAPKTSLRFDALPLSDGTGTSLTLLAGKIRSSVAKATSGAQNYTVSTGLTVAGVRGTDFIVANVPGSKNWICVREGLVEFTRVAQGSTTEKKIDVGAGDFADLYAAEFKAVKATKEQIDGFFAELPFHGK